MRLSILSRSSSNANKHNDNNEVERDSAVITRVEEATEEVVAGVVEEEVGVGEGEVLLESHDGSRSRSGLWTTVQGVHHSIDCVNRSSWPAMQE
jgi:hypothetical protein